MDFRVLGPVELWAGGRRVDLGTGKQRCVLAVLLLGAGRAQPAETLIDRVWGDDPPTQVRSALYSYVSRIRRALRDCGDLTVVQESGGYVLDVPSEQVDAHRFMALYDTAFQTGAPATRVTMLDSALALWRGTALQGLTGHWAEAERQRLARQRVRACAEWARNVLELGDYDKASARLEREIVDHPLAEPLVGQLMVALAAQGRQAEALDCFAALRDRLVEELGVDPGPVLADLHVRLLRGLPVGSFTEPQQLAERVPVLAPDLPKSVRPARRADGRPPYLGLETFQEHDADRFFGRQDLTDELLARVTSRRFLAVFGPSGSGKSSVLRAGMLPALGALPAWRSVLMTPGEHPLTELSDRLTATGVLSEPAEPVLTVDPAGLGTLLRRQEDDAVTVVVVDQFEEIFTLCRDERERAWFIEALVSLADNPSAPARVVIGVRADFYPACADFPALVSLLRDNQLLVSAMAEPELRAVITGPAELAGLAVEPALVDLAFAEVLGEPAALPLLSHALRETWLRRTDDRLTVEDYQAAGGVHAAVAQTADHVYRSFDEHQARIARDVFLRLTVPGEGGVDARRRPRRAELLDRANADEVAVVLSRLADARLITLDEETVTVVHECLIRSWPMLRDWLDEDRELLRARHRLTGDAREWQQQGRDEDLLYGMSRLALWQDHGRTRSLTDLEREFVAASNRKLTREQEKRRRRLRGGLVGLSAAVITLLVLTIITVVQSRQAGLERDRVLAGRLTADARTQLSLDPQVAVLLALRAYEINPGGQTEAALAAAVSASRVRATFTGHDGPVTRTEFSPDGRRLASGGADGTVRTWPVGGGAGEVLAETGREVTGLTYAPDGEQLLIGLVNGDIAIVGAHGEPVRHVGTAERAVLAVAFDRGGQQILAADQNGTLWTSTVDKQGARVQPGRNQPLRAAAFSPDRTKLACAGQDGRVWVQDVVTGSVTPLRGPDVAVDSLVFSPDGLSVAGGRADGREEVWATKGDRPPLVLYPNRDRIQALAFSHDGKTLLSGGRDRTSHLWLLTSRRDFIALRGQGGPVRDVDFSPDDRWVATAADDGTLSVWEPAARPERQVLDGHTGDVLDTAFSADGAKVVSGGTDGTVVVRAADATGDAVVLRGHRGTVRAVAFHPDGRVVASAGDDGTVRVWPSTGGDAVATYTGHRGAVRGVAFNADGVYLASAGDDGTIRKWRVGGAEPPEELHHGGSPLNDIAFSSHGRLVAAADNGTVQVWPWSGRREELVILRGNDGMRTVAVSADGEFIAGAGNDGAIRIWHRTGGPPLAVLTGHYGLVFSVAFSQDGQYVASVGNDKTLRFWHWSRWRDPVVYNDYHAGIHSVAFGAGNRVAIGRGETNSLVDVWRCTFCLPAERLGELADLARQRRTRELTEAEQSRYLGP